MDDRQAALESRGPENHPVPSEAPFVAQGSSKGPTAEVQAQRIARDAGLFCPLIFNSFSGFLGIPFNGSLNLVCAFEKKQDDVDGFH